MLRKYQALQSNSEAIVSILNSKGKVRLIELSNDSSIKTKLLIEMLLHAGIQIELIPISTSKNFLEYYLNELRSLFPSLNIFPLAGNYADILADLKHDYISKLVLLSDSKDDVAEGSTPQILKQLNGELCTGDWVQVDFEIKNDPRILPEDIPTASKNALIDGLNSTLLANFDSDGFVLYPFYNPQSGYFQTCLVSTKNQTVHISATDETTTLKAWETITLDTVKRYDADEVAQISLSTGFTACFDFYDSTKQTCCSFWQKK